MTPKSLEQKLAAAGSAVELARNSQIGPYVYPAVAAEFTNWRDEQIAWRETAALFDQSHHMTDLYVEGPDVIRLLSDVAVNSFENFAVDKAKQLVVCNPQGYVIGDAILFYLAENRVNIVGRPSAHNWVQFHGETGDYDVTFDRDERTAVNPTGRRKLYRFQVQGPNAMQVLEKVTGGPLPEIKFFNMGEITIAGHTVRALHHGMSGVPGRELFGPWDEAEDVRAAIVEAGEEFGLEQVGSRVYATNTLESGWIPCPLPAVFTGDDLTAYREWLPANGYEATGSLGGSFYCDDISDYDLPPHDLGYWGFGRRQVVVRDVVGVERAAERAGRLVAVGRQPLAVRRQVVAGEDGRQRARDPTGLERVRRVDARADLLEAELLAGLDDRRAHVLGLVPGPEELAAGDARHAVVQGADGVPGDRDLAHVEELDLGQRSARHLLQHLHRVRPLDLEAVELPLAGRVDGGALVAVESHLVVAG